MRVPVDVSFGRNRFLLSVYLLLWMGGVLVTSLRIYRCRRHPHNLRWVSSMRLTNVETAKDSDPRTRALNPLLPVSLSSPQSISNGLCTWCPLP